MKIGSKHQLGWIILLFAITQQVYAATLDQLSSGMISLIKSISEERYPTGTMKRFNQAKTLGCFHAEFEVFKEDSSKLKKGLFTQPGTYKSMVRFASASETDDREKDLRGMSFKVYGVEGESLLGHQGEQDFLLNSYPALFVATPEDFFSFIQAVHDDKIWRFFANPFDMHMKSLWILFQARKNHSSPFDIRYWSTTPSRLGTEGTQVVKYSATPCSSESSELPSELSENYLQAAMKTHLEHGSVCFDFQIQLQTNDEEMPIEDASVIWDENKSPFIKVARLTFEDQPFTSEAAMQACEQASFNPWQSLPAHEPLGRMNQVRKSVYSNMSQFRSEVNADRQ